MEVTWKDLIVLLRSNKNVSVICEAIVEVLELDVTDLPDVFHILVFEMLVSDELSTRTNAGELLERLGRHFAGVLSVLLCDSGTDGELLDLDDIEIQTMLSTPGATLQSKLPSCSASTDFEAKSVYSVEWLDSQRRELRVRMGIDVNEGVLATVDSEPYITEEDMTGGLAAASEASKWSNQLNSFKLTVTEESWLARIVRCMVVGLLSPQWEVRHGYSLGLTRLLQGIFPGSMRAAVVGVQEKQEGAGSVLPEFICNDIACCGVCVLLLDRLIDFGESSSGGGVAPVKEVAGQLLTCAMRCSRFDELRMQRRMWSLACEMAASREHWTVALGGFIAIKNVLPFCWHFVHVERWLDCVGAISEGVRPGVEAEVTVAASSAIGVVCASAVSHISGSSAATRSSWLDGFTTWVRLIGNAISVDEAFLETSPSQVRAWSDALSTIATATAEVVRENDQDAADSYSVIAEEILKVCGSLVGGLFVYDKFSRGHCLKNVTSAMRRLMQVVRGKGLETTTAALAAQGRASGLCERMFELLGALAAAGCLSTQQPIVDLRLDDGTGTRSRAPSSRCHVAERGLKKLVEEAEAEETESAPVSANIDLFSVGTDGGAEHDEELRLRSDLTTAWAELAHLLHKNSCATSSFFDLVTASARSIILLVRDSLLGVTSAAGRQRADGGNLPVAARSFLNAVDKFCRVEKLRRPLEQNLSVRLPSLLTVDQFLLLAPMVCNLGMTLSGLESRHFSEYRDSIDECVASMTASVQVSLRRHDSCIAPPDAGAALPKKRRFVIVADTVVQPKKKPFATDSSVQLSRNTAPEVPSGTELGMWFVVVFSSLLCGEFGVAKIEAGNNNNRSQLRSELQELLLYLESARPGWKLSSLDLVLTNNPKRTCAAYLASDGMQSPGREFVLRQFLAVMTAKKLSAGAMCLQDFALLVGLFAHGDAAGEFVGQVLYALTKEHQENIANVLGEYLASIPLRSGDHRSAASIGAMLLHTLRACTAAARRALSARFDIVGLVLAAAGTVSDPTGGLVGNATEVLSLLLLQPADTVGDASQEQLLMSEVVGHLHLLLFPDQSSECSGVYRIQLTQLLQNLVEDMPELVIEAYEVMFATALRGIGDRDADVRRDCVRVFRSLVPLASLAKQTAPRRALSRYASSASNGVHGAIERSSELLQHIFTKQNPFRIQRSQHPRDLELMAELARYTNLVEARHSALSPAQLRDYQWDGVSWLTQLRRFGLNGILADEMGLGKSLQALTAVAVLRIEKRLQTTPTLVVCPASVVMHWEDEVKKYFAADLLYPVRFATNLSPLALSSSGGAAVVIVSYEMVRRDVFNSPRSLLKSLVWECVVLDEAHLIKNPTAQVTQAVCSLQSQHRVALSGTPVQNQVEELWSLMNFLLPDYIGDFKQFRKEVVNPIVRSFAARKELRELQQPSAAGQPGRGAAKAKRKKEDPLVKFRHTVEISAVGTNLLRTLHKQVLPFILRRTKEMVAQDLPSKTVVDVLCPLSAEQRQQYGLYQARMRTSDELLETEFVATKGVFVEEQEEQSALDRSAGELATAASLLIAKEDSLVSEGWGSVGAAGGMSLPSFDEEDKPEQVNRPKVKTLEVLNYLKLLCLHPALVANVGSYRTRLLDSPSSSGKLVRLAVLLMDSGVVARDEFSADHNIDALLQLGEDLMARPGAGAQAEDSSDESDGEAARQEEEEEVVEDEVNTGVADHGESKDVTVAKASAPPGEDVQIGVSTKEEDELAAPLHRCLIFAQHRAALDLVEEHVLRRYFPHVGYERMDGSMDPQKRSAIARRFNDQPRRGVNEACAFQREGDNARQVARLMSALPSAARITLSRAVREDREKDIRLLLMTTRSCGLGLNLTAADTVIFLEHDWNPFADLQAMDRVHRIGQTQPVTIYRLLAESTVEARIMKLQSLKQNIATQIINEDNAGEAGPVGPQRQQQQFGSMLLGSLLLRPDSK